MGFFHFIFGTDRSAIPKRKNVFISFAMEDIEYRNYLVKQAKDKRSPFYFIDMSVKQKWNENEWKARCREKIRRCDGAFALLSNNTHKAGGARWEIKCARQEGVKIIGMHIFKNAKSAVPIELQGKRVIEWSWDNLERFVNNL